MPIVWTTKVCAEHPDAAIEACCTERVDTFRTACGALPTLEGVLPMSDEDLSADATQLNTDEPPVT